MKKLKILFDYGAHILWLYDDYNFLLDNVTVSSDGFFVGSMYSNSQNNNKTYPEKRLLNKVNLEKQIDFLEKKYVSLFINDDKEFAWKGFENKDEEKNFLSILYDVYKQLCMMLEGEYEIINKSGFDISTLG